MALITLQANAGPATLVVTMDTKCAWQFYYNDHLFIDLKGNGGKKKFSMPLGAPATNRGSNAATFYLTNVKADAEPYTITMEWQQNGKHVKTVTLADTDPGASTVPGGGSPCMVSELITYQVIQSV
ncbi:hypothetical protein EJV47_20075 [Hymenobacter gummosus]|uniref:Uncharacterized protein n=1 Tax=Hymenobacter gummosus TaxID=1776032 RepID=A0A3S0H464_9BACT|nr:hypothetical protein [Hymenobacter gummosus]RTQ47194.1 hypothetical protein EJV47_20075 [Hymenobacter gummosus]